MALTDENGGGMVMPVAPMYGGNGGFGNSFGGDWAWIILLLLLGWGNNGWGNNMGGNDGLYPWMNQAGITTNGFQNQLMNDNITSIRDSINGISTQLCTGFAGVEQGANARQIANMQQAFAMQSQFADCCCENRLASCQTQNIIQNESAATRFADANNTRDIIQSQTSGTQAILDKLCQLELDGVKAQVEAKNDRIAELQTQLNMANLAASQSAQNAFIANEINQQNETFYTRLSTCPIPSTPVYGRTPIFTCNQNNGCGCNNNF